MRLTNSKDVSRRSDLYYPFFLMLFALSVSQIQAQDCWVYQKCPVVDGINGVSFTDSNTGWVTTFYDRKILHTTDGGENWVEQYFSPGPFLENISFVDSNNGIVVGDGGKILRTTNGGTSWIPAASGTSSYLLGVHYSSLSAATAVGTEGVIVRSSDGGITWIADSSGTSDDLMDVYFTDDDTGTAVGYQEILSTTDGGVTWSRKRVGQFLYGVAFSDAYHGTIVGDGGTILRTTDGGLTWVNNSINPLYSLRDVSFDGAGNGAILGNRIILRTSDGGATWDSTVFSNYQYLSAVATPDPKSVIVVGRDYRMPTGPQGVILHNATECYPYPAITPVSPPNRAAHQALIPLVSASPQFIVTLSWYCLPRVDVSRSIVQLATDSAFSGGMLADSSVPLNDSYVNTSLVSYKLLPGTKYFWRVRIGFFDSTTTEWSPVWNFTTAKGVISGSVFDDTSHNGIWDNGERGLPGWRIDISGRLQSTIFTNSSGNFLFQGLDSGAYHITRSLPNLWSGTAPPESSYTILLDGTDTAGGKVFGNYFPWNSGSGVVFEDKNNNAVQDNFEQGVANWIVRLSGTGTDSTVTDSLGRYNFPYATLGEYASSLSPPAGWEQIYPQLHESQHFLFTDYLQHFDGRDFAVHKIPVRSKIILTVKDNTSFGKRDIWFGTHPGTTFGIWGADPAASLFDFSEGEFDLPPQLYGLFDARFVAPWPTAQFGYGAWTDMRSFHSSAQVDTYKVSFRPGYTNGGDYPFLLSWSKDQVAASYTDAVSMIDKFGEATDMRTTETRSISNKEIDYILIVTNSPNIPEETINRWNLISLPYDTYEKRVDVLFPSASTQAFSYQPLSGYQTHSVLANGLGYWLRYAKGLDSMSANGNLRARDTVDVEAGWNLIGSLSVPADVYSITTVPPGIIQGKVFGYENGKYVEAETLKPGCGYWMKVNQAGQAIVSSSPAAATKRDGGSGLDDFNEMLVRDADGREGALYFGTAPEGRMSLRENYSLPPLPPGGLFDMRYATGRMLELVGEDMTNKVSIQLTGETYPLRLVWKLKGSSSVRGTLRLTTRVIPLGQPDGSVELKEAESITLEMTGLPPRPRSYSLEQNYPNPFNPVTKIRYAIRDAGYVTLKIYDVLGRPVATLVNGVQNAGYKSVDWNAAGQASGVYFYKLEAGSFTDTKKMLMLK